MSHMLARGLVAGQPPTPRGTPPLAPPCAPPDTPRNRGELAAPGGWRVGPGRGSGGGIPQPGEPEHPLTGSPAVGQLRAYVPGEAPMMSVLFPHRNEDTGELIDVEYFTPKEVSTRLHVSTDTVRRFCAMDRWPHLRVQNRYYMNAAQVARAMELMTHDPDTIPDWSPPLRLGVAMDPDDAEGVR